MSGFDAIDLSGLPAPAVVETVDYETVLSAMLADLQARDTAFTALVESDPAYKVLEVAAYRETLLRQRVNDAARAVMLAYASGADLDQIGANYNVVRLVIDPGDPDAYPPVAPTYETDTAYRRRIQMALEGVSVAGSRGAYTFHALSAADENGVSLVKDAYPDSPTPAHVVVYVLGREGDGTPDQSTLDAVAEAVNREKVRPLGDLVTVEPAGIVEFSVSAVLHVLDGPSTATVTATAQAALQTYLTACHVIGAGVALSGIYEALHVAGVRRVELTAPAQDITVKASEAAYCIGIDVTAAGGANG